MAYLWRGIRYALTGGGRTVGSGGSPPDPGGGAPDSLLLFDSEGITFLHLGYI